MTNGDLSNVAWSRDGGDARGRRPCAGPIERGVARVLLRRFDPNGRRRGADIPVSSNTVMDIRPCGEGFAFAAADPAFGLASAGGSVKVLQGPRTADMRGKIGKALEISGDGATVRFGLGYGDDKPVLFDVAAGSLADSPDAPAGLAPARVDGLPVTDWQNSTSRSSRASRSGSTTTKCLARSRFGPIGPVSLWGRSGMFAPSTRRANRCGSSRAPGTAWGVDFSADGQILVVAYDDGTIRWLRGSDGAELLALFVDVPTRRWVAWTPTGYYMASPGRRGSDRLAPQSRLDATGRFLPRLALLRALQPARHRATRAEDARRGGGGHAGERDGQAQAEPRRPSRRRCRRS